jgi:N-methylhydantoinase B
MSEDQIVFELAAQNFPLEPLVTSVDPITFEIISHRLHQTTVEMGITLERTGGTANTTQLHDYVAALYRANGDILSAGDSTSWHVACAGFAVKSIIKQFEEDGIDPDDIFLLNDPYVAAVHQSDVYVISPIHYKGCLVAWSATFVHVMDIGAMSPGGNSPGATEIFHEGVRIGGIKLVERGKLRKDVFDTIINMTRQPVMVGLDIKCEIAANNVAKSRIQEMYSKYGAELTDTVSSEMIRYSEVVLRKRLAQIPDGFWTDIVTIEANKTTYSFTLTLHKKAERLKFDFTGTDEQAAVGINLPYHATLGACFGSVIYTLGCDLPKNHGAFWPIDLVAHEGTLVNPRCPAPVSLNTTSGGTAVKYLCNSVLIQMVATSERWRNKVFALNRGHRAARLAGTNQQRSYFVTTLSDLGLNGSGARANADGINSGGGRSTAHNVEWFEHNFPVLYLFRRHVKDGAGAGKFRGGAGGEVAITVHNAPEEKIRVVAHGFAGLRNSGQGLFGGYPAAPSVLVLIEETNIVELMSKGKLLDSLIELDGQTTLLSYRDFHLGKDDVLYMRLQSGGGYGDPLERDPQLVLADVTDGLISRETARDVYGVVIDEVKDELAKTETEELRIYIRGERLREVK